MRRILVRPSILFACFVILLASNLPALDMREGLVRIKVDDINGRVALYRLTTVKGSVYESLLFDTDARTSALALSLDGRKIKLGETTEYKIGVRRSGNGVAIEYASPIFVLTQKVEFARSTASRVFDGFKVSYEAKNLAARDMKVALRQIWDTRLGEGSGIHFITPSSMRYDEEAIFDAGLLPSFILSPGQNSSLALVLDQSLRPDQVVIANWKRLSDVVWKYENPLRGFSQTPYSINDSALGLFWNETIIKAASAKTFVHFLLTGGEGVAFAKSIAGGVSFEGEAPPVVKPEADSSLRDKLLLDIEALRMLIADLDSAIAVVDSVSEAELQALQARLAELEAAQGSY